MSSSPTTTRPGAVPLRPAMGATPAPEWSGARWIAGVDLADVPATGRLALDDTEGFATARLLVRDGRAVVGVAEVPIEAGSVDAAAVHSALAGFPTAAVVDDLDLPPVTVAITTRDRPENVRSLVASLQALDYPDFEIVIVDNASRTDATAREVERLEEPRLRLVREPRPGASRGRNTAALEAKHDLIAFIDDDVVVDPLWLRGVVQGFSRAPDVGFVCGMTASGELLTPAQGYFEARIAWETTITPQVFSLADPPADVPLFPFEVGLYGTGANFAVRREVYLGLGGANEALGVGSPTGGGEDIDLFVRSLYAGYALVYEPTSIVWHRHRRELGALDKQVASYGRGFGAWICTVLLDRRMRASALRLLGRAARRTKAVGATNAESVIIDLPLDTTALRRREVVGMLGGPWWYVRSRLDRRLPRPLAPR